MIGTVRELAVKQESKKLTPVALPMSLRPIHNCDDGFAVSAPIGSYSPNTFGLYDMLGNAREWCQDYYDKETMARRLRKDSHGPISGSARAIRGGSWKNIPRYACAADRNGATPVIGGDFLGFRLTLPIQRP